jgi:hypothetical protein
MERLVRKKRNLQLRHGMFSWSAVLLSWKSLILIK